MENNRVEEVHLFSGASKEDKRAQAEREKDAQDIKSAERRAEQERSSLEKHARHLQRATCRTSENASSPLSIELAGACQRGEQDLKQSNAYSATGGWNRSDPALEGTTHNASLDNGLGMSLELPGPGK